VTIENHPHVAGPHASIHPCQHGKVMKTIVKNLMKDCANADDGPPVENYLFIFLKFVSSIIPTINYDFTMEVSASTSK
jgi:ubiquitin-like-conjugating enzyme ATG3